MLSIKLSIFQKHLTEKAKVPHNPLSETTKHRCYSLPIAHPLPILCDLYTLLEKQISNKYYITVRTSQMALVVKILPANAGDTRDEIRSLGQEEPLD